MKEFIVLLCFIGMLYGKTFAQAYNKADLYEFVNKQDEKYIKASLKENGFKYRGSNKGIRWFVIGSYVKTRDIKEIEQFGYLKYEGKYVIFYVPKNILYLEMKSDILNDGFQFIRSKKRVDYYYNQDYIVGFNKKDGAFNIYLNPNEKN